jgi:hypothetical protein
LQLPCHDSGGQVQLPRHNSGGLLQLQRHGGSGGLLQLHGTPVTLQMHGGLQGTLFQMPSVAAHNAKQSMPPHQIPPPHLQMHHVQQRHLFMTPQQQQQGQHVQLAHMQIAQHVQQSLSSDPLLFSPAKAPAKVRAPSAQDEHPIRALGLSSPEPSKARRKRRKVLHSTSKYRGVSWHKRDMRWVARAWVRGKTHNLGTFVSERLAALTVDSCLVKCYGVEANGLLNFPDATERERIAAAELQLDSGDEALKAHPRAIRTHRKSPKLSPEATEQGSTSDDDDDDDDCETAPMPKKRALEHGNNADE